MVSERGRVLIVSEDPIVTDFFQDLGKSHEYEAAVVEDLNEVVERIQSGLAHVVFIDDSCLGTKNFRNVELSTQGLIQQGWPIVLLTDERMKAHLEGLPERKFFRIVRKPVDHLHIGQAMADLMSL